jgi:hypothetical protein
MLADDRTEPRGEIGSVVGDANDRGPDRVLAATNRERLAGVTNADTCRSASVTAAAVALPQGRRYPTFAEGSAVVAGGGVVTGVLRPVNAAGEVTTSTSKTSGRLHAVMS